MICKNCGNDVEPIISLRQTIVMLFLFVIGLLPGVLYAIFCKKATCPVCDHDINEIMKTKIKAERKQYIGEAISDALESWKFKFDSNSSNKNKFKIHKIRGASYYARHPLSSNKNKFKIRKIRGVSYYHPLSSVMYADGMPKIPGIRKDGTPRIKGIGRGRRW